MAPKIPPWKRLAAKPKPAIPTNWADTTVTTTTTNTTNTTATTAANQPIAKPIGTTKEQHAGEKAGKSGTAAAAAAKKKKKATARDKVAKRIEAKLMAGQDMLTWEEQDALCRAIEEGMGMGMGEAEAEAEEDVLVGVATLVANLTEALVFRLAHWLYRRRQQGGNHRRAALALAHKLVRAHLNNIRGWDDEAPMSLEDVGVLMDCQIVAELLEEEMEREMGGLC